MYTDTSWGGTTAAPAASGSVDWGSLFQNGADLLGNIWGLGQANKNQSNASAGFAFNQYRPQYAAALSQLFADPNSVTSMPGYQFGMKQAEDQVQHGLASKGLIGGGTMAATMANTGAQYAGDFLKQQETMLANLAGAGFNPADMYQTQTAASGQKGSQLGGIFSSLPGIVKGIGSIFGI